MSAPPLKPGNSVLARLGELQGSVKRQRDPLAELASAFDLIGNDLETLEMEEAQKLAIQPPTPVIDTTSAADVEAHQNAENDGVHVEVLANMER